LPGRDCGDILDLPTATTVDGSDRGGAQVRLAIVLIAALFAGCATSHSVTVAEVTAHSLPRTAAISPQEGNSDAMDGYIANELLANGLQIKPKLPSGTRKTEDVDLVVCYVDHWFWDLAMYLRSIDLNMFDAKTGNLLVQGHWQDSTFHGFRDPAGVLHEVIPDMLSKLKLTSTQDRPIARN
jgi:hypothetical protein